MQEDVEACVHRMGDAKNDERETISFDPSNRAFWVETFFQEARTPS